VKSEIDGVPSRGAEIARFGTAGHMVAAEYIRRCLEFGNKTDVTSIPMLVESVFQKEVGLRPGLADELVEVATGWAHRHIFEVGRIVGVEENMRLDSDYQPMLESEEEDEAYISSTLDLLEIEDILCIVTDWKWGYKIDHDPLQLEFYAWMAAKKYPQLERFVVRFDSVRWGVVKEREFDVDDLARADKKIRRLIRLFEQEEKWLPTPGDACSLCDYPCPAVAELPRLPIESEGEARTAAERWILLEKELKETKDAMKGWVSRNGNLVHNGVEFGYQPQGDIKIDDVMGFIESATERDINPYDFLSVPLTGLKKLKEGDDWPEWIEDISSSGRSLRFTTKKRPKGERDEEG